MKIKHFLLLSVSYYFIQILSGILTGIDRILEIPPEMQTAAALWLTAVAAGNAFVMQLNTVKSHFTGLRLFTALFLLQFTISVFLTQIETLVFLDGLVRIMPDGSLPVLIADGILKAAGFSLLAVMIIRKSRNVIPGIHFQVNVLKILLLSIIYYIVYIGFGAFVMIPIAGQEAFSEYYSGLVMPVWMPFFQFFRGAVWAFTGLLIVRMTQGTAFQNALLTALNFSVIMGIPLVVPLPFMPDAIRYAHLAEVMSSNFVFGIITGWMLTPKNITKNI